MLTPVNFSEQPSAPRRRTASAPPNDDGLKTLLASLSILSLMLPSTSFDFTVVLRTSLPRRCHFYSASCTLFTPKRLVQTLSTSQPCGPRSRPDGLLALEDVELGISCTAVCSRYSYLGDLIILLQAWYNQPGNHFDMVYGHFAAMGGFAADVEHIHNITKRTTITPRGIVLLARRGKFCQVNRSHIQDKSKADLLAKGLVCVQVLWVAGQAIERKLAGYPMTLLEIHTLVHVVCALAMYGLWLQKPLNVQDQTLVSFEEDQATLAYMLQTSQSNFPSRYRGFSVQRPYCLARREECVMDILDVGEAQSLYVENIVEKSEGLPRLVTQAVIQEGDQELA